MLSPSSSLFWERNSCNKSFHWKDLLIYCIEFNIANLKQVSQKFTSGRLFFWRGGADFWWRNVFFPHPYTDVILLKLSCQNFRIEDLPEYKVLKCKALGVIRQKFSKKTPKKPKQKKKTQKTQLQFAFAASKWVKVWNLAHRLKIACNGSIQWSPIK